MAASMGEINLFSKENSCHQPKERSDTNALKIHEKEIMSLSSI